MTSFSRFTILAGLLLLVFALALGGALHSAIEHDHSHEALWNVLHAILRHEDKYVLLLVFGLLFSVVRFASGARSAVLKGLVFRSAFFTEAHDPLREVLRSGIFSYRKFR